MNSKESKFTAGNLLGYSLCDYSETVGVVVDNERLKKDMANLKQEKERTAEVRNEAEPETDKFNIR